MEYRIPSRSLVSNFAVLLIAAGLIVWAFRLIHIRFTSVTSVDAVVNGILIDLKAPQEGTVSQLMGEIGDTTVEGETIFVLENKQLSQLNVQQIQNRVEQQQAQLEREQAKLEQQLALFQVVSENAHNQARLETLEVQKYIGQMMAELEAAQAHHQLAKTDYERSAFLTEEGAFSQAQLDTAAIEMKQRQAEADSLKNQLEALHAKQQAAQLGLSLSKTRSNFDPRIRLEELQLQIADQRKAIEGLKQDIQAAKAELDHADTDLKRKQKFIVDAPTNGVIRNLSARPGKFVQQGESLGQMLDCDRRWVDVFVDEKALRSIQSGTPATLKLYGSTSVVLDGHVSLIRSGLGRLAAGEDTAVAINPNLPRHTKVRVELASDTAQSNPQEFCYVGYTGRVTFYIR